MTSVQEPLGAHHDAPGTLENHDADLVEQTKGLTINGGSRPASRAASRPASLHPNGGAIGEDHKSLRGDESVYSQDHLEHEQANEGRPASFREPSRSYVKPIPIVTTYESDAPDNASIRKSKSVTGSRAPSLKAASVKAPSIKGSKAPSVKRSGSRPGSVKAPSVRNSILASPELGHEQPRSNRNSIGSGAAGAAAVGEVFSHERQQQMQQQPNSNRVSLHDSGAIPRDRSGALSPRPRSQFGHRPEPRLMSVQEDGGEAQYDGRESRSGVLGRSGTVISRANTMGRNGTLSRTANGGIAGSRRGAFGRGAGTSIGTQPEEVLGRDDIHSRAELSERILGEAALKRLSTMERKDAGRLAKIIKTEAKAEAKAVQGSIKELERLVKLQKEAASQERKSQGRLTKWTSKEHKARLRFLKEKERYEKIEGELRNAENDYEERRDHAAGLTAQVAEKTQDLDDLRAQKAADDREREVKLLALRNPAHS